ncbi:MAG: hypothetical protein K5872_08765 [Rhizobiaceae bacterium]|nr:hypothetical protein [Rhizobiaceae bacterium]MCV0406306.1 hypothetical protein [Rhizobiaceae bacterium]
MHGIVKFFGGIQIVIGIAVAGIGLMMFTETPAGGLTVVLAGFGVVVSGALFWCFGAIVEHLIDIKAELERNGRRIDAREAGAVERHATMERMAAVFDRIGQKQAPTA